MRCTFVGMSTLTIKQKKDYARILYCQVGLTQKETAVKAGVSAKTMVSWVSNGNWDTYRASLSITKEAQLRMLYAQINELNTAISQREEGKRYPDSKEADSLSKMATAVKAMETDAGISETVDVMINFLNWLRTSDIKRAQEFTSLMDSYLKTKLK